MVVLKWSPMFVDKIHMLECNVTNIQSSKSREVHFYILALPANSENYCNFSETPLQLFVTFLKSPSNPIEPRETS